ncbi:MAG TPA: hypothetical protein VL742_15365 [Casimicrobiaceae bacterium]|nr:hypothetical protein [Casimicrobiaceae bacterium]
MRSPEGPQFFHWRRFAVDVLIAAAAFALATATVVANDAVGLLILCGALVGLGTLIEPRAADNALPRDAVRPWWKLRWT